MIFVYEYRITSAFAQMLAREDGDPTRWYQFSSSSYHDQIPAFFSENIEEIYEFIKHDLNNPETKKSWEQLIKEHV